MARAEAGLGGHAPDRRPRRQRTPLPGPAGSGDCGRRPARARACRGFSLVEMLVALAVFALAVLALLNLAGENTRTAVAIEESLLAGVVADNRAVEAMVAGTAELQADAAGTEVAGDRRWRWVRRVHPIDGSSLLRIDIAVMPAGSDRVAAEAQVFRERP